MDVQVFVEGVELAQQFTWPDAGEVAIYSNRAPNKDTPNEDSALVAHCGDGRLVLAVADGVGGHAAGGQASRCALEALNASLTKTHGEVSLREAVLVGIDRANAEVLKLGLGAATTIAAVVIDGKRARAYHVGDSQVIAFGGQGKVKLETIPHSPVGFGVEAGILGVEEAFSHEDRHLVSNVIGDAEMHIGISPPVTLRPRDTIVIASDGLFDNLPVAVVVEMMRRGSLSTALAEVTRDCGVRMAGDGHPDDLTVVVYRPSSGS